MAIGHLYPQGLGVAPRLLGSLGGLAAQGQSLADIHLDRLQMSERHNFLIELSKKNKAKSLEKTVIQELQEETDEWLKDIQ